MRKNYPLIDIVKFICAIIIVFLHTEIFLSVSPALQMAARNTVFTIAVPFFFTMSSYFFFKKLKKADNGEHNKVFWATEKRVIILYLIYSAVYFPFVLSSWLKGGITLDKVLDYIYQFFVSGSFSTIWYLLATIVGLALAYVTYKTIGVKKGIVLAAVFYAFGTLITSYYGLTARIPFLKEVADGYFDLFHAAKNGLLFGWVYMMFGAYFALTDAEEKTKKRYLILSVATFGLVGIEAAVQYLFSFNLKGVDLIFMLLPFTFCFINAIFYLEKRLADKKWLKDNGKLWIHLRKLSVLLFLLQRIPLTLLAGWKTNSLIFTAVVLAITFVLSEIVIILSKRLKFLKYAY